MEGSSRVTAWETKTICPTCKTFAWACQHRGQPEAGEWLVCPACGRMGERDANLVRAARLFVTGSAVAPSAQPTPYSAIDEWMARRDQATTPADGDDYTYDLRTPTERAAFRIEQAEYRLARLEQELRTEIRTLAERLQQVEHVDSTPDQVAGEVFRAVADLDASRRLSGVGQTEGEELDAFFGELEARQSAGKDFVGLDTGFTHLNRVINGLTAGLFILGAAPSTGKTTLAKQIADQVVANHPDAACLFVSLEQSKEELRIKTLSRLSGIENRDLQRGRLDPSDPDNAWAKVVTAKDDFALFADRLQVLEGDRATTVDRIRLAVLQLRQKTQAGRLLVVVDYLQIVPTDDPVADTRQRVNFVTSELRRLGRDLDASVLAIASINRAGYKAGKIDSFKESGDIEFSADIAAILAEDPNKTKGTANFRGVGRDWKRVFLDIVKNRNGERARIELDFYPEVSHFKEAGKGTLPED